MGARPGRMGMSHRYDMESRTAQEQRNLWCCCEIPDVSSRRAFRGCNSEGPDKTKSLESIRREMKLDSRASELGQVPSIARPPVNPMSSPARLRILEGERHAMLFGGGLSWFRQAWESMFTSRKRLPKGWSLRSPESCGYDQ